MLAIELLELFCALCDSLDVLSSSAMHANPDQLVPRHIWVQDRMLCRLLLCCAKSSLTFQDAA